ncbi:hypothetical protein G6F42_028414 [Rhizopus arrhizus]|nr:hypothetical protein G6F42_028414 [Rhizopus arrhizus]
MDLPIFSRLALNNPEKVKKMRADVVDPMVRDVVRTNLKRLWLLKHNLAAAKVTMLEMLVALLPLNLL